MDSSWLGSRSKGTLRYTCSDQEQEHLGRNECSQTCDMLVNYSDSESDTQEDQPKSLKRRKLEPATSKSLPPLPAGFHSLYATNVRTATADDPLLHGGRSRQVPHIEGNWPTHVYLECTISLSELHNTC